MRIAYLDCASGISGDMTLGALVDAGVPLEKIQTAIAGLKIDGLSLSAEVVRKNGFRATQVLVKCPHEHAHRHLAHILSLIENNAAMTDAQKSLACEIFTTLGNAEAKVHGSTVEEVHFHEVGAADSIADIVGVAVGWNLLNVDRIICSPVTTGTGRIRIAHGECSVPAPATAEMLKGIPTVAGEIPCELTTPTGAAIVKTLANEFGTCPSMVVEQIGCGAGQKEIPTQPNLLRLLVGQMNRPADSDKNAASDMVWMLETDLDDCNGEWVGYTSERLLENGALDVVLLPVQMKKGRPGTRISVLCMAEFRPELESILLTETTTLGVRAWPVRRTTLSRSFLEVPTVWGPIKGKEVSIGTLSRFTPEYDVCRRVAKEYRVPLSEVYRLAVSAYEQSRS